VGAFGLPPSWVKANAGAINNDNAIIAGNDNLVFTGCSPQRLNHEEMKNTKKGQKKSPRSSFLRG
jgi:hypothetical protein